jgi:hypothetical protein
MQLKHKGLSFIKIIFYSILTDFDEPKNLIFIKFQFEIHRERSL